MITRNLRIVFMGTPAFAIPCLEFLLAAGYPVVGVITAPDKAGGRGMKQLISSPVKQFAEANSIPVLQPTNLKSKVFVAALTEMQPDLQVVVAFRMLPEIVWRMPPLGTINLHGSLLPAYRGAAPIQWAIIRGEKKTGVTTFMLQHEIDTGLMLLQYEIPILDIDNASSLHDRMMYKGAVLILATVDLLTSGDVQAIEQNDASSSHAPKLTHDNTRINWKQPAIDIYNHIRGLAPYPTAWTILDQLELKIYSSKVHAIKGEGSPGQLSVVDKKLFVQTGTEVLEILELQLTGKKRMKAGDFLNGYRISDWSLT